MATATKAAAAARTLSVELMRGTQDVILVELLEFKGKRARISIRSDSYVAQCSANLEIFDGAKWHSLYWIPGPSMATAPKLYYFVRTVTASDFATDRERLLEKLRLIV